MPAVFAYSVLWFLFVSQFFDRFGYDFRNRIKRFGQIAF